MKIEVNPERAQYPMPCCVVGANVNEKPNFLAVAWFTMVNPKPPYIAVSLGRSHYTNAGIKANGTFSVNVPSAALVEKVDYCGIVSGKKADKSRVFDVFYGKLKTAPMAKECPFNLECRLVQTVDLPADELFIGEILAAYCDGDCVTDGLPNLAKINPFVLSLTDKRYRLLGADIGGAWSIGANVKRSRGDIF
jgi:flavin reductase (DIM6/NTAB) family NADH-FMN oxidoreductase RutF